MKCAAFVVSRTQSNLFEMAGSVAILQLISIFFCCGKLSSGRSDRKLNSYRSRDQCSYGVLSRNTV